MREIPQQPWDCWVVVLTFKVSPQESILFDEGILTLADSQMHLLQVRGCLLRHLTRPSFAAEMLEDFSLILTSAAFLFMITAVKGARGKQIRELSEGW